MRLQYLIIFTFILLSLITSAQGKTNHCGQSDTPLVQSRYIALRPSESNRVIFDPDTLLSRENDMIHVIEKLVASNKIDFYISDFDCRGIESWHKVNYYHRVPSYLIRRKSIYDDDKIYFFDYCVRPDIAISNHHGGDSVDTYGNIVYPWPNCRTYRTSDFDEIHIKEDLIYDETTKQYSYEATGICFALVNGNYVFKKFWIDLRELFAQLEDNNQHPWHDALRAKKYRGFQYMQTSSRMNFKINNQ